MIDLTAVLNNIVAQAPLLAVAILALYYKLDKKMVTIYYKLEKEIGSLKSEIELQGRRLEELKSELKEFAQAVVTFQETVIEFLGAKDVATTSEVLLLRGHLSQLVPYTKSKYYTPEIRERLIALLNKDIEQYTWEDVHELERIAKLILMEYHETKREDLIKFYPKLVLFTALLRGLLWRREAEKMSSQKGGG